MDRSLENEQIHLGGLYAAGGQSFQKSQQRNRPRIINKIIHENSLQMQQMKGWSSQIEKTYLTKP